MNEASFTPDKPQVLCTWSNYHIPPVTSLGEPLTTWLVAWTFSQVVSMSPSQLHGHGFNPYFG